MIVVFALTWLWGYMILTAALECVRAANRPGKSTVGESAGPNTKTAQSKRFASALHL